MQWLKKLFAPSFAPQAGAEQVVAGAKQALGQDLVSVVAYGSWTAGEYMEGRSDLNLLLVARRLDAEVLRRLAPHSRAWGSQGTLKVQVFSHAELRRLAEAFPLEFADMAEGRKVLHGEDPFGRLEASPSRLGFEIEADARRALARYRHRWLLGKGGLDEARELAGECVAWIFPVLRGLLRLRHRRPPRQRVRLIEEAARQFRLSRRTLLQAHDLRYHRKNADRIDTPALMERLLQELERLAEVATSAKAEGGGDAYDEGGERHEGRGDRDRDRGDRDRGDRDRGDRDRERRGRSLPRFSGDRSKLLTEVRQIINEVGAKKRWEPKDPERFVADELSRDANLSPAARFGWDRAWQAERRARGYKPAVVEAEQASDDDDLFDDTLSEGEAAEAAAAPEAALPDAEAEAAAPPQAEPLVQAEAEAGAQTPSSN